MSFNGSSYAAINTTREEGYDLQFRFRTTLSDALLTVGKGTTYYFLRLAGGRLNLISSLLNKLEGVSVGAKLNNSEWQKVRNLKSRCKLAKKLFYNKFVGKMLSIRVFSAVPRSNVVYCTKF